MAQRDVMRQMDWDQVCVGMPVRWSTPRWIKWGIVEFIQGETMVFGNRWGQTHTIPQAKWYFDQPPEDEEHLVVLEELPPTVEVIRNPKVKPKPGSPLEMR